MRIKSGNQVVWRFYQEGRVKATAQTFREADVAMYMRMAIGEIMRQYYFENKKSAEPDDDYYFSGMIGDAENALSDPDASGMRRAEMGKDEEVIRMPRNRDIISVVPGQTGCPGPYKEIVQVQPGEERYYMNADFSDFQFFVQKGKGYNTYNVPACTKSIIVSRVRITDDSDVSFDVMFEAANHVLGVMLRIPGFVEKTIDNPYTAPQQNLKRALQEQGQTV